MTLKINGIYSYQETPRKRKLVIITSQTDPGDNHYGFTEINPDGTISKRKGFDYDNGKNFTKHQKARLVQEVRFK